MQQFTNRQNAIILGGLLGDMHIQKNHNSVHGNCRLRFAHNEKSKEYLEWKYKAFKSDFCQATQGIPKQVKKNEGSTTFQFYTERRPEFRPVHDKWYIPIIPGSKTAIKTVPPDLINTFTDPWALAVWYLDDGTKRLDTASCRIATQSFTKKEHEILQECLLKNFGIRAKIEDWGRSRKTGAVQHQIAILSTRRGNGDYDKFRDLLFPLVEAEIPSMLYKLQ